MDDKQIRKCEEHTSVKEINGKMEMVRSDTHDWQEIENIPVIRQTLRCKNCASESIAWRKLPDTPVKDV